MKIAIMMRAMDKDSGFRALADGMARAMVQAAPAVQFVLIYQTDKWLGRYSEYPNVKEVLVRVKSPLFWDQCAVPWVAWKEDADVIFNTKFFAPLISPCPVTMGLQEPSWFTRREEYDRWDALYQRIMIPISVRRCAHVFPNSRFILEENRRALKMAIGHSTVTYSAAEERFAPSHDPAALQELRIRYALSRPFILVVSRVLHFGMERAGFFSGKSPELAYRAFTKIRDRIPHELVFAGREVEGYLRHTEGPDADFRAVRFLDFVPFQDMHLLYGAADVFVNPCVYEGCPNTVLQAMASGRPVIVADHGGSADVGDGAALMASSMDVDDLAEKMQVVALDEKLRREMSAKSVARSAQFTWQRSAIQTLEALQRVVDGRKKEVACGLSAPAARRDHLSFLDQFRGLAIICVFVYHALFQAFRRDQLEWSGWLRNFDVPATFLGLYPVTWGWCGVAIFFAVSGFCIHLSHARAKDPSVISFFIRRWFRIYPPFLAALLFYVFVFPHTRLNLHSRHDLGQLFSHLLLVHNLDDRTWSAINVAWWSVAVEFQLYLLYPLLLAAARRLGWHGVLVMTAVIEVGLRLGGDIYQLTTNGPLPALLFNLPFYFWFSWAMGAAIADAYVKGEPLPFRRGSIGLWLALFVAADLIKPLHEFSFTIAALVTAIAIARLASRGTPDAGRSASFLPRRLIDHVRLAGMCSYSIYLIHLPILEVWPQLVRSVAPSAGAHPWLVYAGCLASWAIILPLAWIMYRYVELPAIAMGKRVIDLRRNLRAVADLPYTRG